MTLADCRQGEIVLISSGDAEGTLVQVTGLPRSDQWTVRAVEIATDEPWIMHRDTQVVRVMEEDHGMVED
jgi:hypothetical protein